MTAHHRQNAAGDERHIATEAGEIWFGDPLGSIIGRDRHTDLPKRWRKFTKAEIAGADLPGVGGLYFANSSPAPRTPSTGLPPKRESMLTSSIASRTKPWCSTLSSHASKSGLTPAMSR